MKRKRISLCTICMNRLSMIKQTLVANIEACMEYGDAEILLLDYNSRDGLEDWVRENLWKFMASEVFSFYKIVDPVPQYFSHSHSRNIVFKQAAGGIVCNVNADYFIEKPFLEFIAEKINPGESIAYISNFHENPKDNFGRLCVRKEDFLKVGGYDESFDGYGYEDTDLCLRLSMAGVRVKFLPDRHCCKFIKHADKKRTENMYDTHNVQKILWRRISPLLVEVFFLFRNQSVEKGVLKKASHDIPILCEGRWINGSWSATYSDSLKIQLETGESYLLCKNVNGYCEHLCENSSGFFEVTDSSMRERIILKKSQIRNYQLLKDRRRSGEYRANQDRFGMASVMKNFRTIMNTDSSTLNFSFSERF